MGWAGEGGEGLGSQPHRNSCYDDPSLRWTCPPLRRQQRAPGDGPTEAEARGVGVTELHWRVGERGP